LQGLGSRLIAVDQTTIERPGIFDLALRDDGAEAEIVRQFSDCARHRVITKSNVRETQSARSSSTLP
jgi:hypothetical protein